MGTSSGRLPAGQLLPQPSVSGSERIAVPSRAAGPPTGAERLAHAARLVALQQKKGAGSGVSANRAAGTEVYAPLATTPGLLQLAQLKQLTRLDYTGKDGRANMTQV